MNSLAVNNLYGQTNGKMSLEVVVSKLQQRHIKVPITLLLRRFICDVKLIQSCKKKFFFSPLTGAKVFDDICT